MLQKPVHGFFERAQKFRVVRINVGRLETPPITGEDCMAYFNVITPDFALLYPAYVSYVGR